MNSTGKKIDTGSKEGRIRGGSDLWGLLLLPAKTTNPPPSLPSPPFCTNKPLFQTQPALDKLSQASNGNKGFNSLHDL